ncbi:MAG: OFA family MFS transporter [Cellulosilyticaceae bacterium]
MKEKSLRWGYVVLGMLMFVCLGSVYSWSVFRGAIETAFEIGATASGLPYMVCLACYALWMFLTGPFIEKYPPRRIMMIGGVLVGGGWILASYSTDIYMMTLTYGVISGSGVGMIYGVPVAVVSKWFPEKKGLAVGLILAGFGVSPLVTAPLGTYLIEVSSVFWALRILGSAFLVILVLLAIPFRFPEDEHKESQPVSRIRLFEQKTFYSLWICFMLGTLMGLMTVGITTPVGKEMVQIDNQLDTTLVAVFALCNGMGRPLFGWLTDRIGPRKAAILAYGMLAVASGMMLVGGEGNAVIYSIAFAMIWMTLGSWLAIAPLATGKYFGQAHQTRHYGIVFTAYGVGALLGVSLSGITRDLFGSYKLCFYQMLVLSIVGIGVVWYGLKDFKESAYESVKEDAEERFF